jgi:DNA polymerase
MSWSDDLTALSEDIRALLDDYRLRGVSDLSDALEAEPVVAREATETRSAPTPWVQLAKQARSEAVPAYARDAQPAGPTLLSPSQPEAAAASSSGSPGESLEDVRRDLGDCQRCVLCGTRKNIVFGVGSPSADLMVIGEGPGEQEDRRGEPFVGPAGQMLDRMLANVIGLRREQVYIANIVKCRPPRNRNPEQEEVDACRPFLQRQIRAVQPKAILVLGSVALQHLMGVKGITRNRGREMRYRDEVLTIPTFHPAYLLRRPEDKRKTFEDLKLLKQRYDDLGGKR